ncbi:MAG TPA: hypothetical protein ENN41_08000 [Sediminispirochaeta sp.]|nr:hypothetical protein [Sediminispirochaeta sp.]
MKKIGLLIVSVVLILLPATELFAQSAGGGISFFFPESLLDKSGSVSKETPFNRSFTARLRGISLGIRGSYQF